MKKYFLFMGLLCFAITSAYSQQNLSGQVNIKEKPDFLGCARIHISYANLEKDTIVFTDDAGRFFFNNIDTGNCEIWAYKTKYITEPPFEGTIVKGSNLFVEIELTNYDSIFRKVESITTQNQVDISLLSFQPFFINGEDSDHFFSSNIHASIGFNYKFPLSQKAQFGINYNPIVLNYYFINKNDFDMEDNQVKRLSYNYTATSLFVFGRYIFSLKGNDGHLGFYTDLGLGYQLPYSFTFNTYYPNNTKTSVRNIHNFSDFQFMFKVGYNFLNLKANYRFMDIMKDNYVEPPKFTIGLEILIPIYIRQP